MSKQSSEFFSWVDVLNASDPDLAGSLVPTGITNYWVSSLGWPDWVFAGSPFPVGRPLPGEITLSQDMLIMANLVRNVGEKELVAMLLDWPHYPGAAIVLSAPKIEDALRLLAQIIMQRNPTIKLEVERNTAGLQVVLRLDLRLGPYRRIYEQFLLSLSYVSARTFAGFGPDPESALGDVSIRAAQGSEVLSELLPCKVEATIAPAMITIAGSLLDITNPGYDVARWEGMASRSASATLRPPPKTNVSGKVLQQIVLDELVERRRVPQLAEIADSLGMSVRSLSRLLSSRNVSFRSIVSEARRSRAIELIAESDLPIAEVSSQLGYAEPSAFVRAFNKWYDISPGQWRIRHPA